MFDNLFDYEERENTIEFVEEVEIENVEELGTFVDKAKNMIYNISEAINEKLINMNEAIDEKLRHKYTELYNKGIETVKEAYMELSTYSDFMLLNKNIRKNYNRKLFKLKLFIKATNKKLNKINRKIELNDKIYNKLIKR